MATITKSKDLPGWVMPVLSGVGGAVIAGICGVWLNFSDFRKSRLEANSMATEQSVTASEELRPLLDKLIAVALGKAEVNSKDVDGLNQQIRKTYNKAEDVRNRWRGLSSAFDKYAQALVGLKEGADNVTGPLDAKQFIKAYSSYVVADEEWRKAVQHAQNSYLSSF